MLHLVPAWMSADPSEFLPALEDIRPWLRGLPSALWPLVTAFPPNCKVGARWGSSESLRTGFVGGYYLNNEVPPCVAVGRSLASTAHVLCPKDRLEVIEFWSGLDSLVVGKIFAE